MNMQLERANLLKNLHIKGNPLILFNIWDAGSAKAVQEIGAKVIATGSWSVAAAHGYDDGEKLPFDMVLANIQRIIASIDVPITIDFEGGYGKSPTKTQENVLKIIQAGHDFKLFKESKVHWTDNRCGVTDSGYTGIKKLQKNSRLPKKSIKKNH